MSSQKKSRRIPLSATVLLEIEDALNEPLFLGVRAGLTISDSLAISFYNAKRVWNWRVNVTDYLHYFYRRFHQPFFGEIDFSKYTDRILFTWLFDRADLKALIQPLIENYGHDNSVVVAPLASMKLQLPEQTPFILWNDFPKIDMKLWRREFDQCEPIWRNRLNNVLKKHSVPKYVAVFIMQNLQIETQRFMAAQLFLQGAKPKAIVTEYDRNSHASCLALAASQRGVPVISMIHGIYEPNQPFGCVPILSDYVCCWGERHKKLLTEMGANKDQLIVTGCQAISRDLEMKQDKARSIMGLDLIQPVVLLATNPIRLEDRLKYTLEFCIAMSKLPEMSAIVRLHPAESIAEYQELVGMFPQVIFLSNSTISRDESLAAADLVVIHESSFGIDALLKGKLVVILDVLAIPLKIGRELIELAGCPGVKSSGELESLIRKIIVDDDWKKELHEKAEQYALQYCDSYGQDAVNNVCRVINNAIYGRQQRAV